LTPVTWKVGYHSKEPFTYCLYKAHLELALNQAGPNWIKKLHAAGNGKLPEDINKWRKSNLTTNFRMFPTVENNERQRNQWAMYSPYVIIRAAVVFDIVPKGNSGRPCVWMLETKKKHKEIVDMNSLVHEHDTYEVRRVWSAAFDCPHLTEKLSMVFGFFVQHQLPMNSGEQFYVKILPTVPILPVCVQVHAMESPHEMMFNNHEFKPGVRVAGFLLIYGIDHYRLVSLCAPAIVNCAGNAIVESNPLIDGNIHTLPTRNTLGYYAYSDKNSDLEFHVFTYLYPDCFYNSAT